VKGSWKKIIEDNWDWLLDWVWPRYCLGCGREGEWVCRDCQQKNLLRNDICCCPECGLINSDGRICKNCQNKWNLNRLLIACQPTGLLREVLLNYKYKDLYRLQNVLVDCLQNKLDQDLRDYDLVMGVPLHSNRENWRGYNQALKLAEGLSDIYGWKLIKNIKRNKNTIPQVNFARKDRLKNVKGVFCFIGKKEEIENKKILLVDDVCTTGATIDQCARELKNNGAALVDGLVLVRGTAR